MFGIPGKQAVTLRPSCCTGAKLMEERPCRFAPWREKRRLCRYGIHDEFVDEIDNHDEVIEQDGARVIAPMAQMFLFGTEIDYESSLLDLGLSSKSE